MIFVARPLLLRWASAAMRRGDGDLGLSDLAILLALVLVAWIATNLIGIFAVFGAFVTGAVLSSHEEFREAVARRMRDFMTVVFPADLFHIYRACARRLVRSIRSKCGFWREPSSRPPSSANCSAAGWRLGFAGFPRREAACIGS